jgi:hypothetical protein
VRSRSWSLLVGTALLAPVPYVLYAETYLSEAQAAATLFPGVSLTMRDVELTPDEAKRIQKASDERVLDPRVRIGWGPDHEALVIDRVLGKHEFITYAVAIGADGKVRGIEVMEYRETFGGDVRRPEWRRQFVGKGSGDPLRVNKDVQNISGATLSSAHITNGVRRVLQTYELLKNRHA